MNRTVHRLGSTAFLSVLLLQQGCVHVFRSEEVVAGARPPAGSHPVTVASPLRAHLVDGSIVVFERGAAVGPDAIVGAGRRFSLGLADTSSVRGVVMDSVIGVETYRGAVRAGPTLAVSLVATVAIPVGAIALMCIADPKCFGSCPTVYTDAAGDTTLEAELFSYSIAPLLEMRDLDVLHASARDGRLRMDVRNEALETHHINHIALIEVLHAADERALIDEHEQPIVIGPASAPLGARSRDGRDVLPELLARDDSAYVADEATLVDARDPESDLFDHVELTWAIPAGAGDTVALALRARNSLLTSVLFYEIMLAGAGAEALDWMGGGLDRIGSAVDLGAWWHRRMGLHVQVWDGTEWRAHARVRDSGPIAWTEAAIRIPLDGLPRDTLRVRLEYVTDQWRIDQASFASAARTPETRTIEPTRLTLSELSIGPTTADAALAAIRSPDDAYLETIAGNRFALEFDVGAEPDGARTFLLSSQGWYTEWMRPAWLRGGATRPPFTASDASIRDAIALWTPMRADFERVFRATRIPVR